MDEEKACVGLFSDRKTVKYPEGAHGEQGRVWLFRGM